MEIGTPGKSVNLNPRCEEASMFSGAMYIACGQPAEKSMYSSRDDRTYRMCAPCADHNTRRGMVAI